ncbi:DctP family TRAP transporter solute-binding subunit [Acuticoccus kandeliae]|uniref:DctP family TRAP transporter solute-binding subunit n=1 Tax=Acuticoccus kandeliae TaxID=2073160 RepID=UPI001300576A|nr:DctP family TRAP transporter solute-binding subunit [Acuticoccus kandeliae]
MKNLVGRAGARSPHASVSRGVAAALALVTVAAISATGAEAEPLVAKLSLVTTAGSPKGQAAQRFADTVETLSDGAMKVEVYPDGVLYSTSEEIDGLISSNIQFIAPSGALLAGFDSAFQIFDMPFLFGDAAEVSLFFDSTCGDQLRDKLSGTGLKAIAYLPNGFKAFTNDELALETPADFAGLKFRVQSGGVIDAQMKALDAAGVVMEFSQVYTALQQGTIDGQENTLNNVLTQRYFEVQDYLTVSNHGHLDYLLLTNEAWFDGLSEEQRAIFEKAAQEASLFARDFAEQAEKDSLAKLKEAGMNVTILTADQRAAFEEAMRPVYDAFGSAVGDDLIACVRSLK